MILLVGFKGDLEVFRFGFCELDRCFAFVWMLESGETMKKIETFIFLLSVLCIVSFENSLIFPKKNILICYMDFFFI